MRKLVLSLLVLAFILGWKMGPNIDSAGYVKATTYGVFPDSLRTNGSFTAWGTCNIAGSNMIVKDSLRVNGSIVSAKFNTLPDNTTPSVFGGDNWKCTPAGPVTITTFSGGTSGQVIRVVFTNTNATLSDAGTLKLSAAFTSTADDEMTLIYDGTNWYELSRSVN